MVVPLVMVVKSSVDSVIVVPYTGSVHFGSEVIGFSCTFSDLVIVFTGVVAIVVGIITVTVEVL